MVTPDVILADRTWWKTNCREMADSVIPQFRGKVVIDRATLTCLQRVDKKAFAAITDACKRGSVKCIDGPDMPSGEFIIRQIISNPLREHLVLVADAGLSVRLTAMAHDHRNFVTVKRLV